MAVLTEFAIDAPRICVDPATDTPLGLRIEGAFTAGLLRNQELETFTNGANISADAAMAPDTTMTADKHVPPASAGQHGIRTAGGKTVSASDIISRSSFVKAAGYDAYFMGPSNGTGHTSVARFNLATKAFDSAQNFGGLSYISGSARVKDVGDGWLHISALFLTSVNNITGTNDGALPTPTTDYRNYTGDGSSGVYAWRPMYGINEMIGTSVPTVADPVTRDADIVFSSINIPGPGSAYFEGRTPPGLPLSGEVQVLQTLHAGDDDDKVTLERDDTGLIHYRGVVGGVEQWDIELDVVADDTDLKVAYTWAVGDQAASLDGATVETASEASIPTGLTTKHTGMTAAEGSHWYGTVKREKVWRGRLDNATLVSEAT